MIAHGHMRLSWPQRPVIMGTRVASATLAVMCLLCECALAQQQPAGKPDDLDVTMQIIVDPDAKLPDEVVRKIPLPARKSQQPAASSAGEQPAPADAAAKGQQRAREARELGREMSEGAKEKAKEAAEQREQARRSMAEERRRNPGPPVDPPGRPTTPPRR